MKKICIKGKLNEKNKSNLCDRCTCYQSRTRAHPCETQTLGGLLKSHPHFLFKI